MSILLSLIGVALKTLVWCFVLVNMEEVHKFLPKKIQKDIEVLSFLKCDLTKVEMATAVGLAMFFLGSPMITAFCILFVLLKMYK